MEPGIDHIAVCVCTYKRPRMLERLLAELQKQKTDARFTYSIVVVDNDRARSAEDVVASHKKESTVRIDYHCEPEQNIALARNRAVANAGGNLIAFIDDDELPEMTWLLDLRDALLTFEADGILGPVRPSYTQETPSWIIKGKFYERPEHETGQILNWNETRTGNALLKARLFNGNDGPFRREYGSGGEDRDFFRRMIGKGFRFVWYSEAPVYETVPPERCTRTFLLKRALLRGKTPNCTFVDYLKSIAAVPVYTVSLPVFYLAGDHVFMKYLIKDFDHIGRILHLCGFGVIKEKYVLK